MVLLCQVSFLLSYYNACQPSWVPRCLDSRRQLAPRRNSTPSSVTQLSGSYGGIRPQDHWPGRVAPLNLLANLLFLPFLAPAGAGVHFAASLSVIERKGKNDSWPRGVPRNYSLMTLVASCCTVFLSRPLSVDWQPGSNRKKGTHNPCKKLPHSCGSMAKPKRP